MKFNGIGASNGIAIAHIYKLEHPVLAPVKKDITDVDAEIARFDSAIDKSQGELERIRDNAMAKMGKEKADVFNAHLLMLADPEFMDAVRAKVRNEKVNSDFALKEVATMFITMFEGMDNEYMRERAADIKDVSSRVLAHLLGKTIPDLTLIDQEVVIVADDLTPSDTAQLNKKFVKGFATNIGGRTSHSAIMARSLEIPATVGLKNILESVEAGQVVVMNGETGEVIVEPSDDEVKEYQKAAIAFNELKAMLAKFKDQPTVTADGHHLELVANIGTPNDIEGIINNGGEGVGLYRTEFLYMDASVAPSEEEQYQAYKAVLEGMAGKPVVVRTLDIGGDKKLPYLPLPHEENPFLGYRALRMCIGDFKDIFNTQLRALLRASVHGNLKIMFPMVTILPEFRAAKEMLLEQKAALLAEGIAVSEDIEVGMMMEVPASAILADQFAKEADFFSIGTNDLIGYTMAADRMNQKVSYLYQPYNPSILRVVKGIIDASHAEGKWTGMCGEMAGDLTAIPLLVGLGLDEFSMSASSILPARELMSRLSKAEMEKVAEQALQMGTAEEVVELVNNALK
ncbi:phosphoenolpyruvate--protein phosphotransferase [Culicoidibacter larvae]|uniref:Phosphoenolpyruvate-protein phosphotransferase n=1 Tax=Culicoidibacter larvae TaxID=2579976 RepID=A0A5R8QBA9_9FIRM|nr:phosphoenolpyruvate--protein phosphotransferase [Culicoidibacter larvae]TLG73815.1 phosphoenolpyruvate--protein phosphotransferase [Culicoidibacter larvae]